MSEAESHHHGKNEIIIVKRHKGDHDGHHGGAWKIAYADFMTAMMAFFLIMWLVNAANEETKAAVASYFNPIKLTSEVPPDEGLQTPKKAKDKNDAAQQAEDTKDGKSADADTNPGKDNNTASEMDQVKASEADYFENPYAVIADIAQETEDKANISLRGDGGANDAGPGTGADGGEAFKDIFDPDFWTQQIEISKTSPANASDVPAETAGLPGDGEIINADNPDSVFKGTEDEGDKKSGEQDTGDLKAGEGLTDKPDIGDKDKQAGADKEMSATEKPKDGETELALDGKTDKDKLGKTDKEKLGKTSKDKLGTSDEEKLGDNEKALIAKFDKNKDGKLDKTEMKAADAARLAAELQAEIRKALGNRAGYLAEGLIVQPAEGGMLISITDQTKTPMFRSGSAIPNKETVVAMETIAKLLKNRKGQIAIRGHTDGRPFKSKSYDKLAALHRARPECLFHAHAQRRRGGAGVADLRLCRTPAQVPEGSAQRRQPQDRDIAPGGCGVTDGISRPPADRRRIVLPGTGGAGRPARGRLGGIGAALPAGPVASDHPGQGHRRRHRIP
ncbi:MAG: MotB family protein [Rhizobium sp.]|nr:MotB family protein [Rhizobium sp.]